MSQASPAALAPDAPPAERDHFRPRGDAVFNAGVLTLGAAYVLLVVGLVLAMVLYAHPGKLIEALLRPNITYAAGLSLLTCTVTAILSLWVAVPIGYWMSRTRFVGKPVLDAVLDIPIVLPPLVIGLALLILFRFVPEFVSRRVVFEVPAIVLAQFTVAAAFAVRAMRATFDQIPDRLERVAMTLGASQGQAFWTVVFPQATRGMVSAGTLAWARAMGEFGPILIFAGTVPMRTEVLTSAVYLEMQSGDLVAALAVSALMVVLAIGALVVIRVLGLHGDGTR